jgi:enoyl-CoA hydratase
MSPWVSHASDSRSPVSYNAITPAFHEELTRAFRRVLSDPHIVIGLAAGDGGGIVWPQAAGLLLAKRYLLTGDRIPAEAALAMGLVTALVDAADQALPAARALAQRIAALPPRAVQATKKMLNHGLTRRIEETFDLGIALEIETMATQDVVEAISAFREKRTPIYRGV